jgi:hypothetical protein
VEADGRLQLHRSDPCRCQLVRRNAGRPQAFPAGVLAVLQVHHPAQMPLCVDLVAADRDPHPERFSHDQPWTQRWTRCSCARGNCSGFCLKPEADGR